MSLLHNSSVHYSNEMYYDTELDTFEMSQRRQLTSFVNELIQQKWLTTGTRSESESKSVQPIVAVNETTSQSPAIQMPTLKEKGSNLLRLTKTKALQNLRRSA